MSTVICKNCGRENRSHFKFCLGCGTELNKDNVIVTPEATIPPSSVPLPDPVPGQKFKMASAPTMAAASSAELTEYLSKHGIQMGGKSPDDTPLPGAPPPGMAPAGAPPPAAAPPAA
ncbi:zinc ribbon domain-containing protein, partial [Myxococcota bacterium]|nr:zinc ribbon domain-containing protein [Myxococcota bacterium]